MRAGIALILLTQALAAQPAETALKGSIHGTVQDTGGIPVAGISLEAVSGAEPITLHLSGGGVSRTVRKSLRTVTDQAGNYIFGNLEPGTYFIRSERDSESAGAKQVKLEGGLDVTLDLVIPANATVSGHVLDSKGDPVENARVYLVTSEYWSGLLRTVLAGPKSTARDGAYSFDSGLEANRRYYVLVDRDVPKNPKGSDAVEVPTYYPSAVQMNAAIPVVLQPGEERRMVDIKIARSPVYCVEGKVLTEGSVLYNAKGRTEGASIFKIRSAALAGTELARSGGGTAGDGSYRACGLAPGDYRLSQQNSFTEFTVANSDLQHVDLAATPAPLRIQADWDDPPPQVSAAQPFLLNLSLISADGDQTQSFSAAVPCDNPVMLGTWPGDYALDFRVSGTSAAYPKEITFGGAKLSDGLLRVAPGTAGTLHIVLARDVATIAVNVAAADGKPVPHATVVLIPDSVTSTRQLSRDAVHGTTDQHGAYTSPPLIPGKYRVMATAQAIRWSVPDDLERVLPMLPQAAAIEVAPKGSAQIAVSPIVIY